MRLDKLTAALQTALGDAQSLAISRDHNQLDPLHLLATWLKPSDAVMAPLLRQAGVPIARVQTELEIALTDLPRMIRHTGDVVPSPELVKVLNLADKLAQQKNDSFIASEWALLALFDSDSAAGKLLLRYARQMQRTAGSGRAEIELSGPRLGERDELPEVSRSQRRMDHQQLRDRHRQHDGRDVLEGIEGQPVGEQRDEPGQHDGHLVGSAARGQHVRVPLQAPFDRLRVI